MKYLVIIEKTKMEYSAFSLDLPGCVATGATKEEIEKNIREAISLHVDGMHQEKMKIPQPSSFSEYLEVPA